MQAEVHAEAPSLQVNLTIIGFVAFTFIAYVTIGLSLAVLPVFIHQKLGFSAIIAGVIISLQYIVRLRDHGAGDYLLIRFHLL